MGEYEDAFRASTDDPEAFWLGAAQAIDWHVPPTRALDASRPPFYRWFPDGELNVCHNALDRHVDGGRGEQAALIYDSPVTGTKRTYTYAGLRDEVARFAGVLAGLGIGRGDRVVIYLPMVPEADADGYVYVMGRTDDVINVAGHLLSTGGMEEVLAAHPDVAECAVIGVADPLKGQIPHGSVVLKAGVTTGVARLRGELVQLVRDQIGAVASLRDVTVVAALPKTRSGKILRKTMRGIADGVEEPVPSTIDDVTVLDALRPILRGADGGPPGGDASESLPS